jgi:hypothetical protein
MFVSKYWFVFLSGATHVHFASMQKTNRTRHMFQVQGERRQRFYGGNLHSAPKSENRDISKLIELSNMATNIIPNETAS